MSVGTVYMLVTERRCSGTAVSQRWCSRWRHCTTSRKVAGCIPEGVIDILPARLWP